MWLRCKPCLGEGKARGEVWGGARPSAISGDSPKQKAGYKLAGFFCIYKKKSDVLPSSRSLLLFPPLRLYLCG